MPNYSSLADRCKTSAWAALAGSLFLGLAGCGGGSQPPPPPPTPRVSQTVSIEGANTTYGATLTNTNQAIRKMTYNGNQFGNDTTITQQNYSEDLGCLNIGDYSSSLSATGATTHTLNWSVSQIDPTADFSSLNKDMNDKYDERVHNLEGLINDPNCEDTANVIGATSLDGKTSVSVNGNELIVRGVAGSSGPYQIEVEYGSQDGGISKSVLSGNMTEVPWQSALYRLIEESPGVFSNDIYIMEIDKQGNRVGELENLTNTHGQSQNLHPYFSPDGRQIVITSNREDTTGDGIGNFGLYIMDANDGSNLRRVSPDIKAARTAVWCNNGKIFFNYRDSNTNTQGIASINPDGTDFFSITQESPSTLLSGRPACSPDGSRIVYVSFQDGNPELYKSNSNGTGIPERLTNNLAGDFNPAWVLNKIFFTSSSQTGESDLWSINPDGTGLERLTSISGVETDVAFSPDGEKVIFTHDIPSFFNPNLYFSERINLADSSKWKQLTTEGRVNRFPAWRPWPNQ